MRRQQISGLRLVSDYEQRDEITERPCRPTWLAEVGLWLLVLIGLAALGNTLRAVGGEDLRDWVWGLIVFISVWQYTRRLLRFVR